MKANELMIGDWVYITPIVTKRRDYTTKIVGVGEEFILFRKEAGIDNIKLERVQPIILTAEILEKNEDVKDLCTFRDNGQGKECCALIYVPTLNLYYIHELQHALRLCGLNELADNFKI